MSAVTLRDVGCVAGESPLVSHVDLDVGQGECILLCGASGSGKTTLTKCINGLVPSFELGLRRTGELRTLGMDPASCELWELARRVGSVFQNPKSQFYHLSSTDELAFGLEVAGASPDLIDCRMCEVVDALGIESLLGRDVSRMSGGEKQALVFASIAVADPDLYVLDEPTANLDERAASVLHDQIARVLAQGKTVVVAEHRLSFLSDLVTRAVLVEGGRVVREMGRGELASLTEEERRNLGLRATKPDQLPPLEPCARPPADAAPVADGLSLRNLCVMRGHAPVFPPVSLDVARGVVAAVVGPNGAGKSTLLRGIAGLERKDAGQLLLDGRQLTRKMRRSSCSMVMQDVNHQLFCDSVWGECELSCRRRGTTEDVLRQDIGKTLRSLDLAGLAQRHPLSLSGGQKQRLAVACALLSERPVVLLDEPTSGLDLRHMIEMSALLRRLASAGRSVVVATHDREFIAQCCDVTYELG